MPGINKETPIQPIQPAVIERQLNLLNPAVRRLINPILPRIEVGTFKAKEPRVLKTRGRTQVNQNQKG
jgi:hypothetical protein